MNKSDITSIVKKIFYYSWLFIKHSVLIIVGIITGLTVSSGPALVLLIIGGICLILFWPLGVLLIGIAFLIALIGSISGVIGVYSGYLKDKYPSLES